MNISKLRVAAQVAVHADFDARIAAIGKRAWRAAERREELQRARVEQIKAIESATTLDAVMTALECDEQMIDSNIVAVLVAGLLV